VHKKAKGQGKRRASIKRYVAEFAKASGGSAAIVFSLSAVVLMIAIGAAVDMGRWLHARQQTVSAVDAAVLAGGRALQVNGADAAAALEAADKYYRQNASSRLAVIDDTIAFSVSDDGMAITAAGNAYIATPFLKFANVEKLPLIPPSRSEFSKAEIAVGGNGGQNVEVSLILDITTSMYGEKLTALKAAAKDLIDIVVWEDQSEYYAKVALAPYAAGVNVASYANTVRGTIPSGTDTSPGRRNYKFTNTLGKQKTFPISTCATERTGPQAYTDVSPDTAKVGLNYAASNNEAQMKFPCPSAQLMPLTSDKTALKSAIDGYVANGPTAGHIGLAWGWYTLSPNWSGVFTGSSTPASYGKLTETGPRGYPLLKKIAVLMTDGEFNIAYCNGVVSKDTGINVISGSDRINCNAPNGRSDAQALKLCEAMKSAGITIYTVGFQAGQAANDMLSACATDATKVYVAENGDQLRDSFRDIALQLSSLYISK